MSNHASNPVAAFGPQGGGTHSIAPSRVVIEGVTPQVDGGRFPIKRIAGEEVVVEADIFTEGHDELAAVVRFRQGATGPWQEVWLERVGNDRWRGRFQVTRGPDAARCGCTGSRP